jgi:hypothetical protein
MPSPFPGMDPYLEASWRDVHSRLIIYVTDTIQDARPPCMPGSWSASSWSCRRDWPVGGLFPDVRVVATSSDLSPAQAPRCSRSSARRKASRSPTGRVAAGAGVGGVSPALAWYRAEQALSPLLP